MTRVPARKAKTFGVQGLVLERLARDTGGPCPNRLDISLLILASSIASPARDTLRALSTTLSNSAKTFKALADEAGA